MIYMPCCGVCKSTNLYQAFPSGVMHCSNCGSKAAAVPNRNEVPSKANDDTRKKDTPKRMKPLRAEPEKPKLPPVPSRAERRKMARIA